MRLKHQGSTIAIAALLAVVAMVLSYFSTNTNLNIPLIGGITGEKTVLKYWCAFNDWIHSDREKSQSDDIMFINVSYDKQLVDVSKNSVPLGNSAITDRSKLKSLLELIKSSGDYKYVLLDVFFEEGYQTDADSALFALIGDMDRIVIPRHKDGSLASAAPAEKAAFADYKTSISENDFTKYQLFEKDGPSIPLRMYSDLTGRTVKRKWIWYADKGALSRKVVFPKMYVRVNSADETNVEKPFNLGVDILDNPDDYTAKDFSGKFIVIGSFKGEDIHTTYANDLPGCLINYNVFLSMMKGQHKIPFLLILFYFFIFFGMAYMLLRGEGGVPTSLAWLWAKLFVLYSAILTIVCIFVFEIWGQAHDIFFTSTFFSVINVIIRTIKAKQ